MHSDYRLRGFSLIAILLLTTLSNAFYIPGKSFLFFLTTASEGVHTSILALPTLTLHRLVHQKLQGGRIHTLVCE